MRARVRCRSATCGEVFFVEPEDAVMLDPVMGDRAGVRLRCPACRLVFVYHVGDLLATADLTRTGLVYGRSSSPATT